MSKFLKASSVLAYAKELVNGNRCHTTRALRQAHFGETAQHKV